MGELPHKIALIGTSCVGKTTLFNLLKSFYAKRPQIAFVPEGANIFWEENPGIIRFVFATQLGIQQKVIELETSPSLSTARIVLCDRSVIDPAAYTLPRDRSGALRLIENVIDWLPTYRELILLDPQGVPYTNEGYRTEDIQFRQRVHEAFLEILTSHNIPYTPLDGTLEERRLKLIDRVTLYV